MSVICKQREDLVKFAKLLSKHSGDSFYVFSKIELNRALVFIKTNKPKKQEKKTNLYETSLIQELYLSI